MIHIEKAGKTEGQDKRWVGVRLVLSHSTLRWVRVGLRHRGTD